MGFLKFLSKEKKEQVNDLDLPPAPPSLGEDNLSMPDFSDFEDDKSIQNDIPKISASDKMSPMPDMKDIGIPEFPSFPDMDEDIAPPIPPEMPPMQKMPQMPPMNQDFMPPEMPQEDSGFDEDMHEDKEPVQIEKPVRQMPQTESIYIRVDRFKATLGSVNVIRNDLKKSEELLVKLEAMKGTKEKSFEKLKASMEDLQRKILFIDKTLFKGG